jgi:uncharacterized protein YcfJ/chorismate mutase
MLRNSVRSLVMLAVLAAAGCASVLPGDPVMEDARLSVNAARSNPQVASYAPLELAQAVDTLRQADDLAARGGRVGEVHQLATLASQRAALAQQVARTRADEAAIMAQRKATEAQLTADASRRQAESAQIQAAAAQRQAEEAQRLASSMRADAYSSTMYDYRRRENERLYEAKVTYVRAVVGPPQQRCWVEPALVDSNSAAGVNIPGAIIGGAIGGIIGHQIGGGRGQDIATGIGVVGGAAAGANIGRGSEGLVYSQNVQRCEYMPASARADYWDVTYVFNGYEHRTQMTAPPGPTILVNAQGEPRV